MSDVIIDFTEKSFATAEELSKLIRYYPNNSYILVTPEQKKLVYNFDNKFRFVNRIGFKSDVLVFDSYDEDMNKIVAVCTANDFEKRITTETLYESYEFANKLSNINQFSKLIESLKDVAGKKYE